MSFDHAPKISSPLQFQNSVPGRNLMTDLTDKSDDTRPISSGNGNWTNQPPLQFDREK